MRLCGVCGRLPRGAKNAVREMRGRECPRFGRVDVGCCSAQECSRVDARGSVRCDHTRWAEAQR